MDQKRRISSIRDILSKNPEFSFSRHKNCCKKPEWSFWSYFSYLSQKKCFRNATFYSQWFWNSD